MLFKKFFFPQLVLIEDQAEGTLLKQEENDLDYFTSLKNADSNVVYDSARKTTQSNLFKIK